MTVGGLVLAAGAGSRLGRPKALVRLGGRLLVERGVDLLSGTGCSPVVVVLGAAADEVRARAALSGATVVVNVAWAEGMGSSLRAGLAGFGPDVPAVVVALADQPLVGPVAVERLVAAWRAGAVVAVAGYGGAPRNPVLLDRSVWDRVARLATGDTGARPFLRAHPELVTLVDCDGTGSAYDVDTEADLHQILPEMERTCS